MLHEPGPGTYFFTLTHPEISLRSPSPEKLDSSAPGEKREKRRQEEETQRRHRGEGREAVYLLGRSSGTNVRLDASVS